jgi:hypothetical protein
MPQEWLPFRSLRSPGEGVSRSWTTEAKGTPGCLQCVCYSFCSRATSLEERMGESQRLAQSH